jgi:hypothetical protein
MNYEPRDIRQIKLVTGEELLTEVVGEDRIEFLIRNPLKVHKERFVVKGLPREANYFTRWMGFADNQEFIVNKTHIITEALVDDNVAKYYNKMMANIEQDDEVAVGSVAETAHPEFFEEDEEEEDYVSGKIIH